MPTPIESHSLNSAHHTPFLEAPTVQASDGNFVLEPDGSLQQRFPTKIGPGRMGMNSQIIVKTTADEVASAVCEWLIEAIENAIQERGKCSIALSGGSTPKLLYEKIAENELHCVDWSKVALLWGDERNVSQDHEDSNYGMVKRAWLERAEATRQPRAIPQVYPVPVQTNAPDRTAHEYSETIRKVLGENNDSAGSSSSASTLSTSDRMAKSDLPKIDIVLLGLGDDAHTASLFPETQALQESENLFVANFVPKFEAYRLTMTLPLINAADKVAFLVCGPSKRAAIDVVWHGPRQVEKYPAQGIHPANGELLWFLDVAAMPERRQG
jgi:6-phosphogluconolactonase